MLFIVDIKDDCLKEDVEKVREHIEFMINDYMPTTLCDMPVGYTIKVNLSSTGYRIYMKVKNVILYNILKRESR